ncbi:hypothetical protein [Natrinema salaciae]|uniref:Uncharacterized protein n=1 Tax=Natrinema salaciae TaxID=1186196 RepID=A0A1H8ZAN0_9EURY|nr:hypothetical protein [Natrinema salaciae]SEP61484.1 hypothetical protein SAMN04489841_0113 [Natrinema salaciae]
MPLIAEQTDERADRDAATDRHESRSPVDGTERSDGQRRRIDVTDVHTAGIDEYVRANVDTDAVSLEHRGGRTYLLLEE